MNWAVIGVVYASAYAAVVSALAGRGYTRTLVGNIGLLLPPFAVIVARARRGAAWRGRQAVFWNAIAIWAILWFVGQIAWASDELVQSNLLPWFKWPILLQLCASALPLLALVAWPHRGARVDSAPIVAVDILVLVFLTGFLYWSLIIAPGMDPGHSTLALRTLATIGPLVRLAAVVGLLAAAASASSAWATAYRRIAVGMLAAFAVLIVMSLLAVRQEYQTGSPADVGWMLPFFFAAWSLSTSPATPAETDSPERWGTSQSSPLVILMALLAVPVIGYGSVALMPLGQQLDRLRELTTALTVVAGIALVILRLRVERRAAARVNEQVRLLATACEQAGELILIAREEQVVYANDAFCRALGYSRDELLRLEPLDLLAPESRASIPALRERLHRREIVRADSVMARRDGTTFPASWVAAPIVDASGRVTHIVSVVRDMTDEVRLRSHLVRSERLSAIGEFVSGVAHEISNPLQSIIGTLDLLLGEAAADSTLRTDLERAQAEAGRAGRILRNLLTFVRQSPTERVLIDVNETVRATVAVRAYELEVAGIRVVEAYDTRLPVVVACRDEIQQVLANLIVNAEQAMARVEGERVLTVRTELVQGNAVVEVSDTGPGIPPAIAGKIFEPFFTTRSGVEGSGLGLSMSLGIAHAHRGELELRPSSSGSCFRLTLPGAGFPGPAIAGAPAAAAFDDTL